MGSRRFKPHRSWPQRVLIGFNICVIVVALSTAAVFGYANTKLASVNRMALSGALTQPDPTPGAPQNILIVGTDSDLGLSSSDPALQGRGSVTGARGDTIMILHVDPKEHTAQLLSLPRDLWVEIAGQGIHQKINSALGLGGGGVKGAETLINTIEANFQIPINHYVEVDFAGFEKIVSAVGGVPIYFNTGIRDFDPSDGLAHTAIDIPGPGCYTLNPTEALAYARSRHMQYQTVPGDPNTWTNDNGNDFGRIQRQQDFIRRVLKRAVAKGIRDPLVMNRLVDAGIKSVRTDGNLTVGDILKLGRTFRSFNPDQLVTTQLPVYGVNINGAAALEPLQPEAEAVLAPFQNTSAADAATRSVTVEVHNGTGRSNEATNVAQALHKVGFSVAQPSDELGVSKSASIIRYHAGQEAQARLLARHLRSKVVYQQVDTWYQHSTTPLLVLVTGTSLTGVLTQAKSAAAVPGPSTTSTTSTTSTAPSTTAPGASATSTTSTTSTIPGYLPGPTPKGVHCG